MKFTYCTELIVALWVSVLCPSTMGQQITEFELPHPVWAIETGDVGPLGLPLRPAQASTSNARDVIFSATEIGPQTIGVYASDRRILGSGETIAGVPNRTVSHAPDICFTGGPAPWMAVSVFDSIGVSGRVTMQGGRVLFYPGQDPSVAGLPSVGTVFSSGFTSGATSQLAYCGLSVLLPNGSFQGSVHRVTTDGFGRILSMQKVLQTGDSLPVFPVPVTSMGDGDMSPSGRLIVYVQAYDVSTGILHGSLMLDGTSVLSRGDILPGAGFPVASVRSVGVNDRGDWAAAALIDDGRERILVKNGDVIYRESIGSRTFGTPDVNEIRVLGMAEDGRLFWLLSAGSFGVPGVPVGELFRAIYCDDELIASNAGSYLEGERLLRLSYETCGVGPAGRFLSVTIKVRSASGPTRERVVILPIDASRTYCSNGATSSGLTPRLGIYGSSELDHDTGFQVIGRYLPPGQPAIVLGSVDAGAGAVLGASQGQLCLGGHILRSRLLVASSLGDISLDLEGFLPRPGSAPLMPGDEWHFQAWYRDHDANGLSVTRLTEAVAIQFE